MSRFSKETKVLVFGRHWDFRARGQNEFVCGDFVGDFFHVPMCCGSKISFRVTSYPLKEAVEVLLERDFNGEPQYVWSTDERIHGSHVICRYGGVYLAMSRFLDTIPELRSLEVGESIVVYVSIYIHG